MNEKMEGKITKRNLIFGGIVLAVLAVVFLAIGMQSDNRKLNTLLNLGEKYLAELDYTAAVTVFDEAIAIDPKCEEAYLGKAKAQVALGQYEAAIVTLETGIQIVDDGAKLEAYLQEIWEMIGVTEIETVAVEMEKQEEEPHIDLFPLRLNYTSIKKYLNSEETTVQLEILGEGSENLEVEWTSSDENVATVTQDGLVTFGNEPGYAFISVVSDMESAYCQIEAVDPENEQEGKETEQVSVIEDQIAEKYLSVILKEDEEGHKTAKLDNFMEYIYYAGDVVIPEKLTFKGTDFLVSGISEGAFKWCNGMQTIHIPATVQSIAEGKDFFTGNQMIFNPFLYCKDLKEIKVDEESEYFKSVDGVLYSKDGKTLLSYPAGKTDVSYTIPEEVEVIATGAFAGCYNLQEILVEEGNSRYEAMNGMLIDRQEKTLLAYATGRDEENCMIPDGVEIIAADAFYMSEVERVEFAPTIMEMKENAFNNCPNLKEICGTENLKHMYQYFFKECPELESVEIGSGTQYVYFMGEKTVKLIGAEEAINVEQLSMNSDSLADISQIGNMGKLMRLEIYDKKQQLDFQKLGEGLDELSQLNDLDIDHIAELNDLSWIEGAESLSSINLSMDKYKVTDISPLINAPNLYNIIIDSAGGEMMDEGQFEQLLEKMPTDRGVIRILDKEK